MKNKLILFLTIIAIGTAISSADDHIESAADFDEFVVELEPEPDEPAEDTIAELDDTETPAATAEDTTTELWDTATPATPEENPTAIPDDIKTPAQVKTPTQDTTATASAAAVASAASLPNIAVYVTGNVRDDEKTALGTRMLSALVNSGRYRGIERSNLFLAEIEREHIRQRSGAIDDSQISELGRQFGVKYICIAAITPILGSNQISARIVDVETAEVVFIGEAYSPLRVVDDFTRASHQVVRAMFGDQAGAGPLHQTTLQLTLPRKPVFWAAIGLDFIGVGLIAYGIIENENMKKYTYRDDVERSARLRNTAYAVGAAALLSGVTIHLFF